MDLTRHLPDRAIEPDVERLPGTTSARFPDCVVYVALSGPYPWLAQERPGGRIFGYFSSAEYAAAEVEKYLQKNLQKTRLRCMAPGCTKSFRWANELKKHQEGRMQKPCIYFVAHHEQLFSMAAQ